MAWRRSVVYAVVLRDDSVQFRYSPRPAVDATWWRSQGAKRLIPLYPPIPPAWAETACRHLQAQAEAAARGPDARRRQRWLGRGRERPRRGVDVRRLAVRTRRSLGMVGYRWMAHVQDAIELQVESPRAGEPLPAQWPSDDDLTAVSELLAGRLLGELEALQLAERAGIELHSSVEDCLTALALLGRLERRPGLLRTPFGDWRCLRCGATEGLVPWDCAACGETHCWMCEECRALGVVRGCTSLYAGLACEREVSGRSGNRVSGSDAADSVAFESHELTPAQSRAALALERFVDTDARREALVWAVCGAGKTELCFPAVARVLGEGGRVLFAIPRRDVVQELGRRLRVAFPAVDMQVLHGGSGRTELWTLGQGTLTVATTHQVLRFERAFDLVVLDEVDAFPYRGSRMLQDAVESAVRPNGRIVRMSATPGRTLIERADAGDSLLITVPVRHHGRPLPVPELHRDATLTHREGPFRPSALLRSVMEQSLATDEPSRVVVFVPDVASTERVGRGLLRSLAGNARPRVLWSHARDPEREAKIRALQQGRCDVFVATSILERGITVPDVDVVVLFADSERVFSESALVQMAGRVGRTVERPTGRVHFIGGRVGRAMRRAVQQIERLNEEAARLGLLRNLVDLTDAEEPADPNAGPVRIAPGSTRR